MPLHAAEGKANCDAEPDGSEFHHDFYFGYNRRLSCFSHAVSSLAFSAKGGRLLLSATGTGDVKLWDTGSWAEAGKLKHCMREHPRALIVSPGQSWLVVAYSLFLQVFNCTSPYKLEQSIPAPVDELTKGTSEWICVAFSPLSDGEGGDGLRQEGRTKLDQLAAATTERLITLDFSRGWYAAPCHTRSLLQSGRPTALSYTSCGRNIVCGFCSGQLQVWSAASLTLEKTLSAHSDSVYGLTPSPRHAPYESRIVSCSADQTLRVWSCQGWYVEQHIHDLRCDRSGVRGVAFSNAGDWLLSVGTELCIWRVIPGRKGRIYLGLHQRLSSILGGDGVRSVAFGKGDAIAVGSRDGVLDIMTKHPGPPPDPAEEGTVSMGSPRGRANTAGALARPDPVILVRDRSLARQLQRASRLGHHVGGLRPLSRQGSQLDKGGGPSMMRSTTGSLPFGAAAAAAAGTSWPTDGGQMSRTWTGSPSGGRCNSSPALAGGREDATVSGGVGGAAGGPSLSVPAPMSRVVARGRRGNMQRVVTMPELPKGKPQEFSWAMSKGATADGMAPSSPFASRRKMLSVSGDFVAGAVVDLASPARKGMQRVCKGLVQRICLDPKLITADHDSGMGDF